MKKTAISIKTIVFIVEKTVILIETNLFLMESLETLTKLCLTFDCTPNDLLDYKDDGGKLPDTMAIYRIAKPVYNISPL